MDTTADLSPQESLSLADSYFVDEDYELAVDAYAAALALLASNDDDGAIMIRALSHRSAAFYQLKRFQEARDDAQAAVSCPSLSGIEAWRNGTLVQAIRTCLSRTKGVSGSKASRGTSHAACHFE